MLREVLAEQPTNELALFAIGNLSIQSGQFEKAVARFDTLLKINPNHLEAKIGLAQSLWKQKAPNKERAKQLLKEITELKADSLAIYRQVAQEALDNLSKE
jgi:outer membrane protein